MGRGCCIQTGQQKSQEDKNVHKRLLTAAAARGSQYQPIAVLANGNYSAFPSVPFLSKAQLVEEREAKDKKTIHKQPQILFSRV